jgi:DNA primase
VAIPDEEIAEVRAATDIVALVGEHVALKRQGARWVGLCPFHSEKTPSFSVNAEEGLYYCFGCMTSGDAITFLRSIEHLDFVEAVERLAERGGITLHRSEEVGRDRDRRHRLYQAMETAVTWYHERLLSHPDAGEARAYLRSRGYGPDVVRQFRLGWAPDGWDDLARALRLPDSILRDSGLGFVNRAGRPQDAFRCRVLFPIFDTGGGAVALGGRVVPGREGPGGPKYKNSQESPIYSKRRVLYGLNWAKAEVVETGEVVVCEGYTDVIAFFMAGVRRAVATCGTALADEHLGLLKRFSRRVVLAYDADSAGEAAAERVYSWERSHDLDVAVAALPAGSDPAEVGRSDPDALRAAVAGARPFLEFRLSRVLEAADLTTVEGRARGAETALTVVAEHPDSLVRDQYLMQVAGTCRVEPERLREMMSTLQSRRRRDLEAGRRGPRARRRQVDSEPVSAGRWSGGKAVPDEAGLAGASAARPLAPGGPGGVPGGAGSSDGGAMEMLRVVAHHRAEVAPLVPMLDDALFADEGQRAALRLLLSASSVREALDRAGPEVAPLLGRIAVEESDADPYDVVARLAERAGSVALGELRAEARVSDERALSLAPVTGWLALTLDRLREGPADIELLGRLVAWLAKRAEEGR